MTAEPGRQVLFRRLAWSAAGLAFALIVLGGVVRITGSGMGCGEHWPRCNGEWFPPLDLPTLIEIGHRWVAVLVSIFVAGLAGLAWWRHRSEPRLRNPATLAAALLIVQVLLGAITVKLQLPPEIVIAHLGNAMLLLAVLMVAALRAGGPRVGRSDGQTDRRSVGPSVLLAAFGLGVVLLGALVANYNAGLLCQGFPLCNGTLAPPSNKMVLVHWIHRVAAFTFLGLAIWMVAMKGRDARPVVRRSAWGVLLFTLAQIGVAWAMVSQLLPTSLRVLHLLVGTAVWASLVMLAWHDRNARTAVTAGEGVPAPTPGGTPSLLADLVTLTKPRIISLLLVTTVAPMFITGRGMPGFGLVLAVLAGGYLMAGGANTINMWFDRDIDDKMGRTRERPLPSGRMTPGAVLTFGIVQGVAAFAIFRYLVNPLSAWMALGGLLFYVFVYTIWLKRTSPQNIVIGGAAGAFPPVVGWTAMTGHLDLTAVYLFAIIFYWTPPHFWALALIKRGDYARAGIPMLPVVRGERETKIQMLGYTIMLLPLTLLPWLDGTLGTLYLAAALLLGGRLLWFCFRLLREETVTPTAWRMYKYSLLYLFLLFVAMGVDRAVPTPNPFRAAEVLVLKK